MIILKKSSDYILGSILQYSISPVNYGQFITLLGIAKWLRRLEPISRLKWPLDSITNLMAILSIIKPLMMFVMLIIELNLLTGLVSLRNSMGLRMRGHRQDPQEIRKCLQDLFVWILDFISVLLRSVSTHLVCINMQLLFWNV